MAENSKISWTHHTFNPWMGCAKVSPGCKHCYAETLVTGRMGLPVWGAHADRKITADSTWKEPYRWQKKARAAGERHRVFCASLADVFEPRPELAPVRARLFSMIESTPDLDWLLLTKRPERMAQLAAEAGWCEWWPSNVWAGTTAENQEEADRRIPHLLQVPAKVRFLSCEPLLGPLDLVGWADRAPAAPPEALRGKGWDDYAWEDWIPLSTREHIEKFWGPKMGRGPYEWLRDHVNQGMPRTGSRVTVEREPLGWGSVDKMTPPGAGVTGRYVHCWNNIGRLITDEGESIPTGGGGCSGWLSGWYEKTTDSYQPKLHWVIVGGESGPGARPFDLAWARSLRDQCSRKLQRKIAFFMKQAGSRPVDGGAPLKLRDSKGGDLAELPADLRVQQFPVLGAG